MCVCERERERETDRQTDRDNRQTERERQQTERKRREGNRERESWEGKLKRRLGGRLGGLQLPSQGTWASLLCSEEAKRF